MTIPLDCRPHLLEVEANHAPDPDHRKVPFPVGATDGHHTEFQDGGEFRDGQPANLHICPFMTRCGTSGPYAGAHAGGSRPVLLFSDQEWSGEVRSSEDEMIRIC
jgi:hypothetical protein